MNFVCDILILIKLKVYLLPHPSTLNGIILSTHPRLDENAENVLPTAYYASFSFENIR